MKRQTTSAEKALEVRERVKKSKPKFVRQESWRRPRGVDNKMRRKIKGWPPTVNTGYRGPKVSRGLHPSGYKEVLVYNINELKEIDPETQAIKIAHVVGKRKRTMILVEAKKKKIVILNPKEVTEIAKKEEKEKSEEVEEEEKPQQKEIKGEQEGDGGS